MFVQFLCTIFIRNISHCITKHSAELDETEASCAAACCMQLYEIPWKKARMGRTKWCTIAQYSSWRFQSKFVVYGCMKQTWGWSYQHRRPLNPYFDAPCHASALPFTANSVLLPSRLAFICVVGGLNIMIEVETVTPFALWGIGRGGLATWHLPCGPVVPTSRWAATSKCWTKRGVEAPPIVLWRLWQYQTKKSRL